MTLPCQLLRVCRVFLAMAALAGIALAAEPVPRAIWLWDSSLADRPAELVQSLEAMDISTVFLFTAPRSLRRSPQRFSDFLAAAHQARITVHALNGEPQWVMPVGDEDAHDFFRAITEFQANAPLARRFDAIHLDVEPHTLDSWGEPGESEIAQRYLDFLRWTRDAAHTLGLPLAVDVPMLFDNVVVENKTLMVHAFTLADEVAIMSYEPGGNHIVSRTDKFLKRGDSGSAPVWIGISADPRHTHTSNARAGRRKIAKACSAIDELARRNTRVLGAAIHDYEDYEALFASARSAARPAKGAAPPVASTKVDAVPRP